MLREKLKKHKSRVLNIIFINKLHRFINNILALTEHDVVSRIGGSGGDVIFAHNSVDRKVRGLFDRAGGMLFLVGRAHYHIITGVQISLTYLCGRVNGLYT